MKKIYLILVSLLLLVTMCISVFAVVDYGDYVQTVPSDIDHSISFDNVGSYDNMMYKYYIAVVINNTNDNYTVITLKYLDDNNVEQSVNVIFSRTLNGDLIVNTSNFISKYSKFLSPSFTIAASLDGVYYVPVYTYNIKLVTFYNSQITNGMRYVLLTTTTVDQQLLINQALDVGYLNGYNVGYNDGLENGGIALNNLPLVDKLTTFIATFTGDGTAQYITPLALCMILILIYILFIRWVLNLSKSAKLVKLTDIVVLIACICILLIFYIPMIDFTITQHQIVDTVESTVESNVEVIRHPTLNDLETVEVTRALETVTDQFGSVYEIESDVFVVTDIVRG